jgi:hypothetical protein
MFSQSMMHGQKNIKSIKVYKEILSLTINQNIRIVVIAFKVTNCIEVVMLDIRCQLLGVMLSTQLQVLEFFLRP